MISDLECISPLGKSDHCVLSFNYNCYINIMANPRIQRLYDKGNYPIFLEKNHNPPFQVKWSFPYFHWLNLISCSIIFLSDFWIIVIYNIFWQDIVFLIFSLVFLSIGKLLLLFPNCLLIFLGMHLSCKDHCVLSFNYNCYINIMANPRIQRLYDKGNYPEFMNELEQKDWSSMLSEREVIDTNWKKLWQKLWIRLFFFPQPKSEYFFQQHFSRQN
jgi:hypothetical protein